MESAFEAFKKEALLQKKLVRTGEANSKGFMDWLYQQSSIITGLAENQ